MFREKNGKTYVNINTIKFLKEKLREFNQLKLDDIVFYENEEKEIKISKDARDKWAFTGLNNSDFVMSGEYKNGLNED